MFVTQQSLRARLSAQRERDELASHVATPLEHVCEDRPSLRVARRGANRVEAGLFVHGLTNPGRHRARGYWQSGVLHTHGTSTGVTRQPPTGARRMAGSALNPGASVTITFAAW